MQVKEAGVKQSSNRADQIQTERQTSIARRRKLIQKHLERRRLVPLESSCGSGSPQSTPSSPRPGSVKDECVDKYKDHFSFLRDSKFLEDLENDSVDSDIIEEELTALQETPISPREKVVKFLQSNPVQIVLCVIVLLDAGIVIAQILLDLNSVKDKLHKREKDFSKLLQYVRETHSSRLQGYRGSDIETILGLLRDNPERNSTTTTATTTGASDATNDSSRRPQTIEDVKIAPIESNHNHSHHHHHHHLHDHHHHDQQQHNHHHKQHHYDHNHHQSDHFPAHFDDRDGSDLLHDIAHGLHFASIAMLGLLVIEDLVKIMAMGKTFFKHKIEIFDAIIIIFSFAIDIVFLGGVAGEEGQKAAAVLVILLLWRIARVVDGIVVTVKQRQEFRIRLQKRARRLAEKKLETFEEEKHARAKQIEALKDLCSKAGVAEADIAACGPKHSRPVNTTLCALSSVARLSVSMTMLMSSGLYRPRKLEDGIMLPRVFVPRWAKTSPSGTDGAGEKSKHAVGHKHLRHAAKHKSGNSIKGVAGGDDHKSLIQKNDGLPSIMQKFDLKRLKKFGANQTDDDGGRQNRKLQQNHRTAKNRQSRQSPIKGTQNSRSAAASTRSETSQQQQQTRRPRGDIFEAGSASSSSPSPSSSPSETPKKSSAASDIPRHSFKTSSKYHDDESKKNGRSSPIRESPEFQFPDDKEASDGGKQPDANIPSARGEARAVPSIRPCDVKIVIDHASDCHSSSPSPPPIVVPQRFNSPSHDPKKAL